MSEKTFPPSIERLRKARQKGDVPSSKLVTIAGGLIAGILALRFGPIPSEQGELAFRFVTAELVTELLKDSFVASFRAIVVPLGASVAVSVLLSQFQSGGLIFLGAMVPKVDSFGPIAWCKRGWKGCGDAFLGLLRALFLLLLLLPVVLHGAQLVQEILRLSIGYGVSWNSSSILVDALIWKSVLRCGIGLALIGGIAYGVVRWRYMKKHMMSLHEVKEESREQEGDPHVKSARRHEHEALLMTDLAARVKRAKVIVVERRPT